MQRSIGLAALVLGATLLSTGTANAKDPLSRLVNKKATPPAQQNQKAEQTQQPKQAQKTTEEESTITVRTHENLDVTPEERNAPPLPSKWPPLRNNGW